MRTAREGDLPAGARAGAAKFTSQDQRTRRNGRREHPDHPSEIELDPRARNTSSPARIATPSATTRRSSTSRSTPQRTNRNDHAAISRVAGRIMGTDRVEGISSSERDLRRSDGEMSPCKPTITSSSAWGSLPSIGYHGVPLPGVPSTPPRRHSEQQGPGRGQHRCANPR